jgi:uncharacterized protein YyaL (SSP411 family)
MNRLAHATSPYLLQHKDNPVDWREWGPDPLAEARAKNKPILLSVGYAACHWCHVMAHESFEDPHVAAVMNELFVNIKVDREERPDVDHVYMSALHLLGEQGGWPLTMFLTPMGEPFWGGTYFPKEPRFGRPGFVQVLRQVARVFRQERPRIEQNRQLLTARLREGQAGAPAPSAIGLTDLDRLGERLVDWFDPLHGGMKGAPKFPNPPILEFLYRYARRRSDGAARARFLLTLERMALGGIHDHLGGGFARYSVDERWLVPHFEKMLYDNAQLLELYAGAAQDTGSPLFRTAAEGIVAWLEREMTTPEGAFASSLDADSEGEEGKFYVWSLAEIRDALGDDAEEFARIYDVSVGGNWEHTNILNRLRSGAAAPDVEARLARTREKLLQQRAARVRPGLDDKVLADWNGLTIAALVRAALALDKPEWIALAARAFGFVAGTMSKDDRLGHSWRDGALIFPGFALDHAAMMRAALALYEATEEQNYLDRASAWRAVLLRDYLVPDTGALAMTAAHGEALIVRPQPTHDEAVPNANGVFAEALVRLAALTGAEEDRRLAEDTFARLTAVATPQPIGHTSILNALDLHLRGLGVVVVNEAVQGALTRAALRLPYLDRSVYAVRDATALAAEHPAAALARSVQGATALVCAGMRCSLPVTAAEDLAKTAQEMLGSSIT